MRRGGWFRWLGQRQEHRVERATPWSCRRVDAVHCSGCTRQSEAQSARRRSSSRSSSRCAPRHARRSSAFRRSSLSCGMCRALPRPRRAAHRTDRVVTGASDCDGFCGGAGGGFQARIVQRPCRCGAARGGSAEHGRAARRGSHPGFLPAVPVLSPTRSVSWALVCAAFRDAGPLTYPPADRGWSLGRSSQLALEQQSRVHLAEQHRQQQHQLAQQAQELTDRHDSAVRHSRIAAAARATIEVRERPTGTGAMRRSLGAAVASTPLAV